MELRERKDNMRGGKQNYGKVGKIRFGIKRMKEKPRVVSMWKSNFWEKEETQNQGLKKERDT